MAVERVQAAPPPASSVPTPEPVAAPAPAAEAPAPAPEPVAVATETPAVETPPTAEAPAAPAIETPPSILEEAKATDPVVEPPKAEETPPAEAPAPTYETLKLPEGIEMLTEELGRFTAILGDNKIAPEVGQKLLEAYTAEIQRLQTDTVKNQYDVFNTTRQQWREEFAADPEIGGNRRDTTIRNCGAVLEQYGSPELRAMLTFTGAGDHPAMIKFINNIGKVLGEPRPVAAAKPPAVPVTKAQRRYAGNAGS